MNRKRLRRLIELLQGQHVQFQFRDCRICIGGWCKTLWPEPNSQYECSDENISRALDISHDLGVHLAYAHNSKVSTLYKSWADITKADAIRVLINLHNTGEVDWNAPEQKLRRFWFLF